MWQHIWMLRYSMLRPTTSSRPHVEGLLPQGQTAKAARLSSSVCQIDHFPLIQLDWGLRNSRLSREHPAWFQTVDGVLSSWQVSKVPWRCMELLSCVGSAREWPAARLAVLLWASWWGGWTCFSLSRCVSMCRTTSMAWSPISSTMETAWWTSFNSGTLGVRGNQQSLERPLYPDSGRCGRVESTTGQSGQIFVGMGGAMEAREELLPPCRACTRAVCQVFLIRLQELSARPMSRLSPRSPSGFSSGYCGLGMFVGLLMQLRSTP